MGDYHELRPGAAVELQERLNHHFEIKRNAAESDEGSRRNEGISDVLSGFIALFSFQGTESKSSSTAPVLPLTCIPSRPDPNQSPNSHPNQSPNSHPNQSPSSHPNQSPSSQSLGLLKFLLLCVRYDKWAIKLRHANASGITSDVQLFQILASEYRAARHRSVFSMRKLASIKFLRFEALQKAGTIGVRKIPDYPPMCNQDYDYKPRPLDLLPPISENEMMHYFHCPDHGLDIPLFLERMPIKLNGRLDLSLGYQTGWGIIFNDGISWKKVWMVSFVGMLFSAIAGLIWWSVKNDAQGGSVIAGISAPLILVTMGAIQGYLGEID